MLMNSQDKADRPMIPATEEIKNYLGASLCELLPNNHLRDLHELICYKILTFLNESDNKILFVQIPVEELSNNIRKQSSYWRDFCETVALAVRLSLKWERLICKDLKYPGGDWYNNGDNFLLIPDDANERFYYLTYKEDEGKFNFEWENRPGRGQCAKRTSEKQNIISNAKAIHVLERMPAQRKVGFDSCLKEIDLLNSFPNGKYASGVIVCSSIGSQGLRHAGEYINPTVKIRNSGNNEPIESDIIAVVGDNNLENITQRVINSLAPYGPRKKLIVIGALPTQYMKEQTTRMETFTLNFKQIYNYCTLNEKFNYKNPELKEIKFPWLKEKMSELEDILESLNEEISHEEKKHIYNYTKKIFSSILFTNNALEAFKQYFVEFL